MKLGRHIPLLALLLAAPAHAGEDRFARMPSEMKDIGLTEKTGTKVPLDLAFTDADGRETTLRKILARGLPVLLTFNYSDCPVLCSTQLELLSQGLARVPETPGALALRPGRQYQIVTIALDPKQTPEKSRAMRERYVKRFPAATADEVRTGWHFLSGPEDFVKVMADSIGMSYRWLDAQQQFVHPAVIAFLATDGTIVRYIKGVDYEPIVLGESIWAAGTGSQRDSVGFILTCFHYDADAGSHTAASRKVMRYGAAGFVVVLLLGFVTWHHVRSRRDRKEHA
jgi:protein SCO1